LLSGRWEVMLDNLTHQTAKQLHSLAGRLRRGPQEVRRDIQVPLAPSVSRRLIPFAATVLRSLALLR
jgi:hypothetical protein